VFHADCALALYQVASVKTLLEILGHRPRVLVLGLEGLAALDARGIRMIQLLAGRCRGTGSRLVIGGAGSQARAMLARAGLLDELGPQNVFPRMREALAHARRCARR
jgi:MFS superfamily sulfate permease-like transporter